jgi:hypothetical protein
MSSSAVPFRIHKVIHFLLSSLPYSDPGARKLNRGLQIIKKGKQTRRKKKRRLQAKKRRRHLFAEKKK